MTLSEAISAVTVRKPLIYRKKWIYPVSSPDQQTRVLPTDSPSGCLLIGAAQGGFTRWCPTKEDLLAEDWEISMLY